MDLVVAVTEQWGLRFADLEDLACEKSENLTRAALTLSFGVLIVPYGYLYDLTGYSTVMAAMFLRAPDARKPLYGLLWLAGGY